MGATAQVKKGKLLWEEDFDGKALDTTVWNYELGNGCPHNCGWGNNERQSYTKENHTVKGGKLRIKIEKEGDKYTSTRITTAGKKEFKYGYMEARAKIPKGHGIWPAFWMLGSNIRQVGWPLAGEIDIMEYVGREPGQVYNTVHTKAGHGASATGKKSPFEGIEDGWHTYGADWSAEKIDFYVDDKLLYTFAPDDKSVEVYPFTQPFYFILNVAVGGNFGGPDVDDTIFPEEYIVDYVRVYANGSN
jgi:beta-glucanase (GH16 family)